MSARSDGSVRKKQRAPRAGWNPEEPPAERPSKKSRPALPVIPLAVRKLLAGDGPAELLLLGEDLYHPLVVEKQQQLVSSFLEWGASNTAAACCTGDCCPLACKLVRECEPIRVQVCASEAALAMLLVRALDSRVQREQDLSAHSCCRQLVQALCTTRRTELTSALISEDSQLCMLLNEELCDATFVYGLVSQAESPQRVQLAGKLAGCFNSATAVRLVQLLASTGPFAAEWCHQLLLVQSQTVSAPSQTILRARACSSLVLSQPLAEMGEYGSGVSAVLKDAMDAIDNTSLCDQASLVAAYCAWSPMHSAPLDHIASNYLQSAVASFESKSTAAIVHTQVVTALDRALRSGRECLISAVFDHSLLRRLMSKQLTSSSTSTLRSHLVKIAQSVREIDRKYLKERTQWTQLLDQWFEKDEKWECLQLSPCAIVPNQLRSLPVAGRVGVDEVNQFI